jgi:hypothetical protein
MSAVDLQYPILGSGIRTINFFNGRLLTALDLTREQAATHEADVRLGQAIGEGIAFGLEVSKSPEGTAEAPIVTVKSGLAVNRNGQVLRLVGDPEKGTDVALVRRASDSAAASKAFTDCLPLQSGTYIAGAGVYLLTLAPAESNEGKAPTNGLTGDSGSSCNKDATVTTVQFRLIQLDPPLTAAELQDENHLRNLIAYKCFGVAETQSFVSDPFGSPLKQYGLLDSLRVNRLTDCDVPLAILYWTISDGIKFIDLWSVRRHVIQPPTTGPWRMITGERRLAEAEAMLLQFQDQLETFRRPGVHTESIVATDYFKYLPSVGFIPITGEATAGFNYERFLQNVTYGQPIPIEGARVAPLLRDSFSCEPIDLTSGEPVWLFQVKENTELIDRGGPNIPQPYLILASNFVPLIAQIPGSSVVIDRVSPTGTLTVGQEIEVQGRGFASQVTGNVVSMGGILIERFLPTPDPSRLRFSVPNISGVPRTDVVITVRYRDSSDSRTVSVNPAVVIPTGRLMITDVTGSVSPPGTILAGNTYTFWFDLDSQTLPGGESYRLSATYSNAAGANVAAWNAATSLVSATGAALSSTTLRLNPGSPVRVGVKFTVPSGATRADLTFVAQSVNNDAGLSTSLGPIPIVVGVVQPVSDSRVSVVMPAIEDGVTNVRIADGGIIEVRYRSNPRLNFLAEMNAGAPATGDYQFSCALEPDPGPWALTSPSPAPTTTVPVSSNNDQTIQISARLNADAVAGSNPEARTLLVTVQQIGGEGILSFRRFPIRGF